MSRHTDEVGYHEPLREGITMALYISVSLLAVLLATPTEYVEDSKARAATTLALTALGLLLAHTIAFRLSTRLLNRGVFDGHSLAILQAQLVGGLPAIAIAAVPVLVFGGRVGVLVSVLLLVAVVAGVGFATARASGAGTARTVVHLVGVIAVVAALLALKVAVKY